MQSIYWPKRDASVAVQPTASQHFRWTGEGRWGAAGMLTDPEEGAFAGGGGDDGSGDGHGGGRGDGRG